MEVEIQLSFNYYSSICLPSPHSKTVLQYAFYMAINELSDWTQYSTSISETEHFVKYSWLQCQSASSKVLITRCLASTLFVLYTMFGMSTKFFGNTAKSLNSPRFFHGTLKVKMQANFNSYTVEPLYKSHNWNEDKVATPEGCIL